MGGVYTIIKNLGTNAPSQNQGVSGVQGEFDMN